MNQKQDKELENRCINTIRMLSADAVQNANAGYPGMPMGAAAMAYTLWTRFLRHNPHNPRGSIAIALSSQPATVPCSYIACYF